VPGADIDNCRRPPPFPAVSGFAPPTDPFALVKGLRVVRAYRRQALSQQDKTAILEAGRWTGSSKNRQGWKLVVLESSDVRSALADCGDYSQPLRDASWAVATVKTPDGNNFDIGRLAQNLMLAAHARGVGSCPVTLHRADCAREVLQLPDKHTAGWVVSFGYPDEKAEKVQRATRPYGGRQDLADLVVIDRFG
jgi:nitroreductase